MAERIGRPPRDPYDIIDYHVAIDSEGSTQTPVRVIDRIEETLRSNAFMHDAAARAGISTDTLRSWRAKGVRASAELLAGKVRRSDLDRHTKQCIELARRMERAEADSKTALLNSMTQLARGGLEEVRVTQTVRPDGTVVDNRVQVKTLLPDAQSIGWLLTHRWPKEFATSSRIEVSGPEGGPVEVEVSARERLIASIAAVRGRRSNGDKVIDVDSSPKALPNGSTET